MNAKYRITYLPVLKHKDNKLYLMDVMLKSKDFFKMFVVQNGCYRSPFITTIPNYIPNSFTVRILTIECILGICEVLNDVLMGPVFWKESIYSIVG